MWISAGRSGWTSARGVEHGPAGTLTSALTSATTIRAVPGGRLGTATTDDAQFGLSWDGLKPQSRVNAVDPGCRHGSQREHRGHKRVEDSARIIVEMAAIGRDGPTGGFFDEHGTVPW